MYLYNMFKDKNDTLDGLKSGDNKVDPVTKKFRKYTPVDGVQGFEFSINTSAMSSDGHIAMEV